MTTLNSVSDYLGASLAESKDAIAEVLGEQSVEALAQLLPIEIAKLLAESEKIEKSAALNLANRLLLQLKVMGFKREEKKEEKPISVTVESTKTLTEMSLKEQLFHGISFPEDAWDVVQAVESDEFYQRAVKRTAGSSDGQVIAWNGATINPDETLAYIIYLSQDGSFPQAEWQGLELVSLKTALHLKSVRCCHPLKEVVVIGPDEVGHDYTPLDRKDPELWDAIVWARRTSNPLFPASPDLFEAGEEILAHIDIPLKQSSRWERMRKAYCGAKRSQKAVAGERLNITVKKSQEATKKESPEPREEGLSEDDYQKLVYENLDAVRPEVNLSGSSPRFIGGVVKRLVASGSSPKVTCVVLESACISGSSPSGTIFVPSWSINVSIGGSSPRVDVKKITWKHVWEEMRVPEAKAIEASRLEFKAVMTDCSEAIASLG